MTGSHLCHMSWCVTWQVVSLSHQVFLKGQRRQKMKQYLSSVGSSYLQMIPFGDSSYCQIYRVLRARCNREALRTAAIAPTGEPGHKVAPSVAPTGEPGHRVAPSAAPTGEPGHKVAPSIIQITEGAQKPTLSKPDQYSQWVQPFS